MLKAFGEPPIFGEVHGDWPPDVVALHGWGRDRGDFRVALRGLSAVAVDLPGFGASPAPPEPWGSREYAGRLIAVVEAAGSPVVLVGHSFGGRIAVRLAAMRPDEVRAIVLTGAPIARSGQPRRQPALAYRAIRRLHKARVLNDTLMEWGRNRYGSADYRQAQGVMRDVLVTVLQEDYQQDLRGLAQPVALLWGTEDREVPVGVAEAAAALIGSCTVEAVPGVGHDLPWRAPDRLRGAILGLIRPAVGS
ncbi:MAG: alpha/beta fold hydrolase [Egibacteraceae bacterium]